MAPNWIFCSRSEKVVSGIGKCLFKINNQTVIKFAVNMMTPEPVVLLNAVLCQFWTACTCLVISWLQTYLQGGVVKAMYVHLFTNYTGVNAHQNTTLNHGHHYYLSSRGSQSLK